MDSFSITHKQSTGSPSIDQTKLSQATDPQDLIITCSVQEMAKFFVKDYVIVWHDPNVNSPENAGYLNLLKAIGDVITFTNWQKASEYVKSLSISCHVVTSGTDGESFINAISEKSHSIISAYVFCGNKAFHSIWAQKYKKPPVYVETNLEFIIHKMNETMMIWQRTHSSIRVDFPAFAPIFEDKDITVMNKMHTYLQACVGFENRAQAKESFLALSRAISSDTKYITTFNADYQDYDNNKILNWYTKQSFLYQVVNNCLRIATDDSILYARLVIKDLQTAIREQFRLKSHTFHGKLYRGAYISAQEWTKLESNIGREIEMFGFLSTSKLKDVALDFAATDTDKKALITILVPASPDSEEQEQGFVEIKEFSEFPGEEEVLFNIRSRFTILETNVKYVDGKPCRCLTLLYGAQALKRYITNRKPIVEVNIEKLLRKICSECHAEYSHTSKMMFIDLKQQKHLICLKCINKCEKIRKGPYIALSAQLKQSYVKINDWNILKVEGIVMEYNHGDDLGTPFYGSKCIQCQQTPQSQFHLNIHAYGQFQCLRCPDKKQIWCGKCFDEQNECCNSGHQIIMESTPFTFWSEGMLERELAHYKYHQEKASNYAAGTVFGQGQAYYDAENYIKAKEHFEEAMRRCDSADREKMADIHTALGATYKALGEYQGAIEKHTKSLEIRRSIYGEQHSSTASSYNDLGSIYYKLAQYQKAEEMHTKCLEIYKSKYGEQHSSLATSYNNLGLVYNELGQYYKAGEMLSRSLEICESKYGEQHSSTASSYNNLGSVYDKLGQHQKALKMHTKCLEIYKSIYGEQHSSTATSYNSLGLAHNSLGQYQKAEEMLIKSLEIRRSTHGEQHPSTAFSYDSLGFVYDNLGQHQEALEMYTKSLEIRRSIYGEQHPSTALSYNNLGQVYNELGQYQKAVEMLTKALETQKSVYGEQHSSTASSYKSLGLAYYKTGEHHKAIDIFTKSLEVHKSIYGEQHSLTVSSYKSLGLAYFRAQEHQKAIEIYTKSLEIHKSIYGEQHPDTIEVLNSLTFLFQEKLGR